MVVRSKKSNRWQIKFEDGKVVNTGETVILGKEYTNLIRIVVALFDLKGFTNFFHRAAPNKNVIVSTFINGFLDWFNYRLTSFPVPLPKYWKFLGDGILLIWEVERDNVKESICLQLMNACWNMVCGKKSYETTFLSEFVRKVGRQWNCNYPSHLRVSLSGGHAVKYYSKQQGSCEYTAECINIASRLVNYEPELYFIAHGDLYLGPEPEDDDYVQKQIRIRGINHTKLVTVFIDKDDFDSLQHKTKFWDIQ